MKRKDNRIIKYVTVAYKESPQCDHVNQLHCGL